MTNGMKILAPVTSREDVVSAALNGADECYCGLHIMEWQKKYGPVYYGTNRSDFYHQNFLSLDDLSDAVSEAHRLNLRVYLTMNVPYPESQIEIAKRQVEAAVECGIDAVILGDIGLLQWISYRDFPVELHVSCDMTGLNNGAIEFFRGLGVRRMVLPRHMTLGEIADLQVHATKIGNIDLEIFVLNGNCINLDGMCGFHHGVVGYLEHPLSGIIGVRNMNRIFSSLPAASREPLIRIFGHRYPCCRKYDIRKVSSSSIDEREDREARVLSDMLDRQFLRHLCAACALYDLRKAGIRHIKIIGRENFGKRKNRDLKFVRKLVDMLEENPKVRLKSTKRKHGISTTRFSGKIVPNSTVFTLLNSLNHNSAHGFGLSSGIFIFPVQ